MNRSKLLRMAGYGAFANLSLLIGIYLTFPSAAVGQRIAYELQRASGGKISATIGEVSLYRLTGIEARDVRLRLHSSDPPIPIVLEEVTARLQLLPLLWLQPTISTTITAGGSEIEAEVSPNDSAFGVVAEIDKLNFQKIPLLTGLAGFPVNGVASGKADVVWARDPRVSKGDVTLTLQGLSIGPGEPVPGFSLPNPINLGQLDLALSLDSGQLVLKEFEQSGAVDLEVKSFTADATLRPTMRTSSYNTCIQVKPEADFLEKNPKLATALEFATVGGLKKDPEGYLHANLSGSFGAAPRPRPVLCSEGGAAAARGAKGRPPRPEPGRP